MKISVVLAHPEAGSLNHAIAGAAVEQLEADGHAVSFHDLYGEGFDPLLASGEFPRRAALTNAVREHCREIAEANGIVIVHPNWWGQPPAILKGWVDRVIRLGVAYEFLPGDSGEGVPKGLLKAEAAAVFNTSNTEPERERRVFGDPLETLWKNCIFGFCGVGKFHRRNFSVVVTSSEAERREWLETVKRDLRAVFPNRPLDSSAPARG
jgi:NAD(P)H dehydrogenase (quinone)